MSSSLLEFAKYERVNTASGLAKKAGLHWPPPPTIKMSDILRVLGVPLKPIDLKLSPPIDGGEPINPVFYWTDSGANTPKRAQTWKLNYNYFDKQLNSPISSGVQTSYPSYSPANQSEFLKKSTTYMWNVYGENRYGIGPFNNSTFATTSGSQTAPSPQPRPMPSPSKNLNGVGKIQFFNYSPNGYTVHFWTHDLNTNEWHDWGELTDQTGKTNPASILITLEDKHSYNWYMVVIIPGDMFCNTPIDPSSSDATGNCTFWSGWATRDAKGPSATLSYPYP
jgi:hypothetical protein